MSTPRVQLTLADIPNLPPALDIPTVAALLGISRTSAYQLAAADHLPVPVIRVGRSLRVPTTPLLAVLGLAEKAAPPAPDGGAPGPGVARDQEP